MEVVSCGVAVAQSQHRISLVLMSRKRQLGCSSLHSGHVTTHRLTFFSATARSIDYNLPRRRFPSSCRSFPYPSPFPPPLLPRFFFWLVGQSLIMQGKYRARSPPRNFKVSFIEEPPLTPAQRNYLTTSVPRIARTNPSAEDFQIQLSQEMCREFKQSVGVTVTVKPEDFDPQRPEQHLKPITFRFTLNEFLFRVWLHQPEVEFESSIRQ